MGINMDLNDDIIGKSNVDSFKDTDFQWNWPVKAVPENQLLNAMEKTLQSKCSRTGSARMGDAACEGCTFLWNGMCLASTAQSTVEESNYSIQSRSLMKDLLLQILDGLCWNSISSYLRTRYSQQDLQLARDVLRRWLAVPGILGFALLDNDLFASCKMAKESVKNKKYSPRFVKRMSKCNACLHARANRCSLWDRELYSSGNQITSTEVIQQINALFDNSQLSSKTADECRKLARTKPVAALSRAVRSASGRFSDSSNFANEISGLGKASVKNNVTVFENEPIESQDEKFLLLGSQMQIPIDPAPKVRRIETDIENFKKNQGAGLDEYLKSQI